MGVRNIVNDKVPGEHLSDFATTILHNKDYSHRKNGGTRETWPEIAERVTTCVVAPYLPELVTPIRKLIEKRIIMPGGRYLYAAGRRYPQVNSCFLYRAVDSREGWGNLFDKCANALMTGGGVGVVYSDIRQEEAPINGMGGYCTGPVSTAKIVNEEGRYMRQGGSRRSALWAGLHWWHVDIFKFIHAKDWPALYREGKKQDFNFPAPLDMTNISVILDDEFFAAYYDSAHHRHHHAHNVFWAVVRNMLMTGEPGFSVDVGDNAGECLRNACCEVTSATCDDMCNLSSLNMSRIKTKEEFAHAEELAMAFLICGTLYSKLPVENMYRVRERNRRLGLGMMGLHEWLLRRGYGYGPNDELADWMKVYAMSGSYANRWADRLGISRPVATRSIAPNGTISIIGETTSGVEPIYAVAQKRRYLDGQTWKAQYIVDATAKRLIDAGVDPDLIEDSLALAEDVERRMAFQAWLQQWVDHGISSTINLPPWGSSLNNDSNVTQFGNTLLKYLPHVRGITVYPDGSRDGQPLVKVPYSEAIKRLGVEIVDQSEEGCKSGVCGM